MNKKLMWMALGIFLVTSSLAVVINSLAGAGLHFNYTISRYVGLGTWSAIVFAVGNLVVAGLMLKYLYGMADEWKMPRWVYWLIVVMLVALIGLSAYPIGYFDPAGARYGTSTPSLIHGICSRVMFAPMLVLIGMVVLCALASKQTKIAAVIFMVYGVFCLYGYFARVEWFENVVLMFESLYLFGFMVMCLMFKGRKAIEGEKDGRAKR